MKAKEKVRNKRGKGDIYPGTERKKNRNGNGKKEPRQKWEIQLLTGCLQGTEGYGWDCTNLSISLSLNKRKHSIN